MAKMGEPNRYVVGASGRSTPAPDSKATGARLVAKVMLNAERGAVDGDRLGEPPGVRFRIGENVAKKINHDAAPK
jgi:hypothetical protein